MINRGVADFTLDYGQCPKWLFDRMTYLGKEMVDIIIQIFGPDEFIKRISDPVWFQSLGTVLAFDWNASGLTTILTASLKQSIKGREKDLGVFICGGKGKTSLKTPDEINNWGYRLALSKVDVNNLAYNSKMAAKIDSALIQDDYQIYHHSFFFSKNGAWAVVQQGMNIANQSARRYHWHSASAKDLVNEPHSGISSQKFLEKPTLNLVSHNSEKNRETSLEMVDAGYRGLIKDVGILRRHFTDLSKMATFQEKTGQLTLLKLEDKPFTTHPVVNEDFSKSKYLDKILYKVCDKKPDDYKGILETQGVGPKTMRALSLVSEVIYGAKPSYTDPARYSFAHGGKDMIPYPVDVVTYDQTIEFFRTIIPKMKVGLSDKNKMMNNLGGIKKGELA